MSIALLITSATTSNFHPPYNENKSNFSRTKLGFVHKKDSLESSVLKIETNPKSRFFISAKALVHKICCKCRVGFSSVAVKCGAASSFEFNISDFVDYEGRVDLEMTEAVTIDGSDPNIGSGSGHGNSDSGGGGHNSGSGGGGGGGGGGLDESAGWEGVKWWCWWLFEAWKNYYQLGHYSSEVTFSRIIMPIIQEMVGHMIEPELEAILMALLMALFLPICVLPVAAFTGVMVAMGQLALLFAVGVLGCVVAIMLFLFFEFSQHHNL